MIQNHLTDAQLSLLIEDVKAIISKYIEMNITGKVKNLRSIFELLSYIEMN